MSLKVLQNESQVYNAVVEYLKEKRELKLDDVLPYLKHRLKQDSFNTNNESLIKVLQILIRKKLIVEGSRLVRYNVLNNSKRKNVYRYIVENPGVYHYEITKDLDIASQVVIWHLRILVNFKLIKKAILDNHEVYFDKSMGLIEVRRKYYLRKEKCIGIISMINSRSEGLTKTKLSKLLKMHPSTIKKYIIILLELGVILEEKYANKTLHFINKDVITFNEQLNIINEKVDTMVDADSIKTESEIDVEKHDYICVVHKGSIEGTIYLCPECQTTYCLRCAKKLSKRNEKCWSCNNTLKP